MRMRRQKFSLLLIFLQDGAKCPVFKHVYASLLSFSSVFCCSSCFLFSISIFFFKHSSSKLIHCISVNDQNLFHLLLFSGSSPAGMFRAGTSLFSLLLLYEGKRKRYIFPVCLIYIDNAMERSFYERSIKDSRHPFDTLISTPRPADDETDDSPIFLHPTQRIIAVYVKFMNRAERFSFFRDFRSDLHSCL